MRASESERERVTAGMALDIAQEDGGKVHEEKKNGPGMLR